MIARRKSLWVLAHTANSSQLWAAFNSFNEKAEKTLFKYQSYVESSKVAFWIAKVAVACSVTLTSDLRTDAVAVS